MKCIQFDFARGLEGSAPCAFGIRIAYLLSDCFNLVGNSTFLITVEEVLKTFTLPQRIKMLYNFPTCEPEFMLLADTYFDFQKQMRQMKHPPNAVFLAAKKMESVLDNVVQEWVENFKVNLHRDGFTDMIHLADDDTFDIHNADHPVGESERGHLCGFEVLNNQQPLNAIGNSIWMQSEDIYHSNFFETNVATTVETIEDDMPYFIHAFQMPNINLISISELKSVKTQIETHIATFKKEANEWASLCYKGGGKDYFIEKVLPTFTSLQQAIDNDPILIHLSSIKEGKVTISAYLGEISPLILWKYYHQNKTLTDIEYNTLVVNYDDLPNYTIPILLYTPTMGGFNLGEDDKEILVEDIITDIDAVKKHINID